jgi:ribosomal protein L11 methyltransferase
LELLVAHDFTAFVLDQHADDCELTVYHLDDQPAPLALLDELGLVPVATVDRPAEELWQAANQAAEVENLAPGVWLVAEGATVPADARYAVRVPVGGGFGDGRHATTRLAAQLLLAAEPAGKTILDLGCGSGVLGVLAHLAGAQAVAFSDIDVFSLDHTRRTCALNGLDNAPIWKSDLLAGVPADYRADLVVANLYGDFLVPLLSDPRLHTITTCLVLSGISDARRPVVESALADHGWTLADRLGSEGWWGLAATAT